MQNSTELHRNKGVLDIKYWEYPYRGFDVGYGLVNGCTRHTHWHGKHMSLAGAISAKHILAIHIPTRGQAVSCCRHDAYSYTYRMVISGQALLLSATLTY